MILIEWQESRTHVLFVGTYIVYLNVDAGFADAPIIHEELPHSSRLFSELHFLILWKLMTSIQRSKNRTDIEKLRRFAQSSQGIQCRS